MLPDQIASLYGAKTVALRPIRPGQGGAQVLEATLGGTRYALRISGPYLSDRPDWIEFEGALLERANTGVAKAIRGQDNRYSQRVEGGMALLTEWADGDIEWPAPPAKAEILGKAVARLHRATQGMETPDAMRSFGTEGLLDRPMALLSEIADPSPLKPFVEDMRQRIDAIPRTPETFHPIHGDVHQGNCHFDGDKATLFDFAQCGVGWRAFDLAGFLWPWRDAHIEKPELRAACDAYLAGYQSELPLLLQEIQALPAFIRARDLWEAGEWVATGDARQKPAEVQAGILTWATTWDARPLISVIP